MLTNNRIQTIDRRAFRALEGLVYIVLKGNPIGNQPVRFQVNLFGWMARWCSGYGVGLVIGRSQVRLPSGALPGSL